MPTTTLKTLLKDYRFYPHFLEKNYPRIFHRIEDMWGNPDLEPYLNSLLVDHRSDRAGFPLEAANDIFSLVSVWEDYKVRHRGEIAELVAANERNKEVCRRYLKTKGYTFDADGLVQAVEKNDTGIVQYFLINRFPIDQTDKRKISPLGSACLKGNLKMAHLLLSKGANANVADEAGMLPLHWAAHEGHIEIILKLLENRAWINARSKNGKTPLLQALSQGKTTASLALIQHGASPTDSDNEGCSPLHLAVEKGYPQIIKLLINKGADPKKLWNGESPLDLAKRSNKKEVMDLITKTQPTQ